MALSTIYTWLVLGAGLGILYFLACGVTEERVRKWARKGLEQADEMEVMRLQTCAFPLFPALSLFVAVLLILGSAQALYEELPGKITGSWPICEGTIQGWHRGYRSSKGYAMIEVEGETKGYDILNGRIQKGELVGVTVRMACNGNRACILEYHTPEGWVREMYLPNYGREPYVVAQTLAMNLLAGVFSCGLILDFTFPEGIPPEEVLAYCRQAEAGKAPAWHRPPCGILRQRGGGRAVPDLRARHRIRGLSGPSGLDGRGRQDSVPVRRRPGLFLRRDRPGPRKGARAVYPEHSRDHALGQTAPRRPDLFGHAAAAAGRGIGKIQILRGGAVRRSLL